MLRAQFQKVAIVTQSHRTLSRLSSMDNLHGQVQIGQQSASMTMEAESHKNQCTPTTPSRKRLRRHDANISTCDISLTSEDVAIENNDGAGEIMTRSKAKQIRLTQEEADIQTEQNANKQQQPRRTRRPEKPLHRLIQIEDWLGSIDL